MAKGKIGIVVFLCGACLMMMELTGSRVLAPYVGTSVFVWSSLIGIILGALSIGAWLGGYWADRYQSPLGLALIIWMSGLSIFGGAVLKDSLMYGLMSTQMGLQMKAFWGALILYAGPSLFLGMITPYAVRLSFSGAERAGRIVGNIYAISTLGSIVGTFATGFFLVPLLGSSRILMLIVMILSIVAMLLVPRKRILWSLGIFLLLVMAGWGFFYPDKFIIKKHSGVVDVETSYNRVWIYNQKNSENRSTKVLRINNKVNSAMYNDSDELVYDYLQFFNLADRFSPRQDSILLIGGGAFSYPMDVIRKTSRSTIDVVELDPTLEGLARQHFGLEENPRISIYNVDGRVFLNQSRKIYDVILLDAFQSMEVIPFQLTTYEAVRRIHDLLHDDGVVMVNIIGAVMGEGGKFIQAEYRVYQDIFRQVYLFPLHEPEDGFRRQNFMLVATKSDREPEWVTGESWGDGILQQRWTDTVALSETLLTDDFAPVEYFGWLNR